MTSSRPAYWLPAPERRVPSEVNDMTTMKNAVVVVTGAGRGLGRALVSAALEAGARKVYAGARDVRQLDDLIGPKVVALALDVTSDASLAAAAAAAPDATMLVNNAGVLAGYGVLSTTPADLRRDFDVNVFGTLAATRAFLPVLEKNDNVAIVNVLSVASLASVPGLGGYAAAKAASYSMTQALRADLAPKGIKVLAALPGPIDTEMVKDMPMAKTSPADVARAIIEGIEGDETEIRPDPVSRQLYEVWKTDPRAYAAQLASFG